jgi:hypothetical protein
MPITNVTSFDKQRGAWVINGVPSSVCSSMFNRLGKPHFIATVVIVIAASVFTSYVAALRNKSFSVEEETALSSSQHRLVSFAKSNSGKAFIIIMWIVIGLVIAATGYCFYNKHKNSIPSL